MGKGRKWTSAELEYLQNNWGEKTIPQLAEKLNRSINAIKVKSTRLGLIGQRWYGEMMSANKVAELMRVDLHTVTDYWIAKCGLKASRRQIGASQKKYLIIKFKNLLSWLQNNQEAWDSRRLDKYALGQEYDWLVKKRKVDSATLPKRRFQKYTKREDELICSLFKAGNKTYKEIGVVIGRSADSVERRLSRLDVWGTGKYIGHERQQEKKKKKETFERLALIARLSRALLIRRNELGYDPYWQRFMCLKWDDIKGCTANCADCDSCTEFKRIQPQYCVRCGATFYERAENKYCASCRTARKKQAQRKWRTLNSKVRR